MEDFARILISKSEETATARFGLFEDSVSCTGTTSILKQLLERLKKGLERDGDCNIISLDLESMYKTEGQSRPMRLDARPSESEFVVQGLQRLAAAIHATSTKQTLNPRVCVVLEALSILILQHSIHQDLHPREITLALESSAKCILKAEATWPGLQSSNFPHSKRVDGSLVLQDKRRTGKVQTKRQWYQLQSDGSVAIANSTDDQVTSLPVVEIKAEAKLQGNQQGMRFDLTPEETLARQQVALPYEQVVLRTGNSLTGREDQKPLGQILYVRDSESEHDSDEDPDDDLDI